MCPRGQYIFRLYNLISNSKSLFKFIFKLENEKWFISVFISMKSRPLFFFFGGGGSRSVT